MNPRFLLAIVLSIMILIAFDYYQKKMAPQPVPDTSKTEETKALNTDETLSQDKADETTQDKIEEKRLEPAQIVIHGNAEQKSIVIETPLYIAKINTLDGVLESMHLKNYKYSMDQAVGVVDYFIWFVSGVYNGEFKPLPEAEIVDPNRLVNMVGDSTQEMLPFNFKTTGERDFVVYESSENAITLDQGTQSLRLQGVLPSGLIVRKTIQFDSENYVMKVDVRIENPTENKIPIYPKFQLGAGNEMIQQESRMIQGKNGAAYQDGDIATFGSDESFIWFMDKSFKTERPVLKGNLDWIGVMDQYFVVAGGAPDAKEWEGRFTAIPARYMNKDVEIPGVELVTKSTSLPSGDVWKQSYKLYYGPKVVNELIKFDQSLEKSLDLMFELWGVTFYILSLLKWIQINFASNWGMAIIILTFIVRVVLFPLALKGMKSMKRMAKLNPRMKRMREKYKDDKQRLNKEIMELYKKNKINPVGGCLPMFIQMPVFFAMYSALLPAIELRHAPFIFWIHDMSAPDPTLILPLLMGATMIVQQKLMPTPNMDPIQAKIMKWMPVIFLFFFINFPVGLVWYYAISNIISIFQQMFFNKIKIKGIDVGFEDYNVCFAGVSRKDLEKLVKEKGGKVVNKISAQTSHLVVAEKGNAKGKENKAIGYGVEIMEVAQFEKLFK